MRERERDRWCDRVMNWLAQYRCVVRFDRQVEPELLTTLPARTPSSYRPGTPDAGHHGAGPETVRGEGDLAPGQRLAQ
jgi:hypothetical protein